MLDFETEERFRFILGQSWAALFIHEAHAQGIYEREQIARFVVAAAEECIDWNIEEMIPWLNAREAMAFEWDALMQEDFNDLDNYFDAEFRGELP